MVQATPHREYRSSSICKAYEVLTKKGLAYLCEECALEWSVVAKTPDQCAANGPLLTSACSNARMSKSDKWVRLMQAHAKWQCAVENLRRHRTLVNVDLEILAKAELTQIVQEIGPQVVQKTMGVEDAKLGRRLQR
jgi:hypothetical protein